MYLLIPKLPILTPTPKHSQAFDWSFSPYSGNLEICPVGIGLSSENSGQHHKQKDFVILSTLCIICSMIMGHYSYIHCFVGTLESLWKSQ